MSLRARLLLGLGLVAVITVAVAVLITSSTRHDLVARVDDQLRASGRAFPAPSRPRPGAPGDTDDWPTEQAASNLWVRVVRDDGDEVTITRYDEARPLLDEDSVAALLARPGVGRTVPGQGADSFRVMSVVSPERSEVVLVGLPLDDVDASVGRLVLVEVLATGTILVVLGLVASWVLALGVRPLKRMTGAAVAISEGDLSVRVPEADPRTEAGELGIALNRMLSQLEASFAEKAETEERLRRFVADASHELRTPITTIRGYAELHRQGGLEDPEARHAAMARTEQEAVRMGALVEDLLLLARLDEGRPLASAPVDLSRMVADVVADAQVAHPGHEVVLVGEGAAEALVVEGDDHRLRQVLTNVLGNAAQHTPPGTRVEVGARAQPGAAVLEVRDFGQGMSPALAERAFERFARGDAARNRHAGSTGLGLSIVSALVDAHGGEVELHSIEGEGTTVTIRLPMPPPSGGPVGSSGPAGPVD